MGGFETCRERWILMERVLDRCYSYLYSIVFDTDFKYDSLGILFLICTAATVLFMAVSMGT